MSINATRTRSTLVENSLSWVASGACLVSSSAPFLRAATIVSSGNGMGRFWVVTVLSVAVFGFKLCSEALEFLKVCMLWIRVWRHVWKQGRMGDGRHEKISSLKRRQVQMDKALNTKTYEEWMKTTRQTKQEHYEHNHKNSWNDALSSTSPTIIRPRTEKACVICLDNFENNDMVSYTKKGCNGSSSCCKHIFHSECLQVWLKKHTSCPMCRYCMLPDP